MQSRYRCIKFIRWMKHTKLLQIVFVWKIHSPLKLLECEQLLCALQSNFLCRRATHCTVHISHCVWYLNSIMWNEFELKCSLYIYTHIYILFAFQSHVRMCAMWKQTSDRRICVLWTQSPAFRLRNSNFTPWIYTILKRFNNNIHTHTPQTHTNANNNQVQVWRSDVERAKACVFFQS